MQRSAPGRTPRWLLLGLLATACASAAVRPVPGSSPPRFRHAEQGWSVGVPGAVGAVAGGEAAPAGAWRRIELDRADLAFRLPAADATALLQSRCDGPRAEPRILARHLLIGAGRRTLLREESARVDGRPAWLQWVELPREESALQMKTVTAVLESCVVDWVLAAPGSLAAVEPGFDAWWRSFDAGEAAP